MTPPLLLAFAAFSWLAVKNWRLAFLVFCGILPAYLIRFDLAGLPTTALETIFWILFFAWFFKREKRFVDIGGWKLILLAWLVVTTVAAFVSPDLRAAAGVWKAYFLEPILFFIIANDFLRTDDDRRRAVFALACSASAGALMAIVQAFTGWGVPPPWNAPGEFRATSFYGFPNAIGLFLAPLIPLFIQRSLNSPLFLDGRRKTEVSFVWFFRIAAALSFIAIVLAKSEGALVGLAAAAVFAGVISKKNRWLTIAASAVIGLALLTIPAARGLLIEKLTINDWSGRVRKEMWAETWNMLKDRPVLGAGLSGYPTVFKPYHLAGHIEIFQYPHNIFLNFWTELGLLGVVLFLMTVALAFRRARNPAITASFIVILVHGLVDVPYFKNDLAFLFWLLIAFISSMTILRKKPD